MKRLACLFGLLLLCGLASGARAGAEEDTAPCTLARLGGGWGFSMSGFNHPGPAGPIPGPAAETGVFTADREGNFSGTVTLSLSGTILPAVTFTGTAIVNPDCTGSATVVSSLGLVEHFDFVVVDKSRELLLIQLAPGSIIRGSARKQ